MTSRKISPKERGVVRHAVSETSRRSNKLTSDSMESMASEKIEIVSGHLGNLLPQSIEIHPLTVFVGRQGTAKSLVAQMLFLFRAIGDLVKLEAGRFAITSAKKKSNSMATDLFGQVVDGLRSGRRRLASFTNTSATIEWMGLHPLSEKPERLRFDTQPATRRIIANKRYVELVANVLDARSVPLGAVFIPADRLLLSLLPEAQMFRSLELSLIFESFAVALDRLWDASQDATHDEIGDTVVVAARKALRSALGGDLHRTATSWKWKSSTGESARLLDLDMASSGQRSSACFDPIAMGVLALKARKRLGHGFTIYIEEPETHLHPEAQQQVIEFLAMLTRHGIRVVLTTHSLAVLQVINNLLLRSKLDSSSVISLDPKDTEAYLFHVNGTTRALMDREHGFIDDTALGEVSDDLQSEMNQIAASLHRQKAIHDRSNGVSSP